MDISIFVVHTACLWIFVLKSSAQEVDERCKVDCACCKKGKCGLGTYFSEECTLGCIDGYRGARCWIKCKFNCPKCAVDYSLCTACYDGYYLGPDSDCTSKCLPGCKTCTTGTTCTSCKEGYENNNNTCNSLCPSTCSTCLSKTSCGSCKDGYYIGYQNDNIDLPKLNNCTYKCRDNCVRCTSYDNCSVCKTGLYETNCAKNCSIGCSANTCDIQTGNCECDPNYAGERCDKCKTGKYGKNCGQQCPTGCKNNVCEKDSGECTDGCTLDTIIGNKCDVCLAGWYGKYCNMSCSVGCKNQRCNESDGKCLNGCLDNFVGGKCNQCLAGKFGEMCNSDCPHNCDYKGCLKDSGNCIECSQNFGGVKCEKCAVGFFSSLCSEICPVNCLDSVCDRESGTCSDGCKNNYSGDICCINNNNCITCLSETRCKQCTSGYFNDKCDKQCPEKCLGSCNIESGNCSSCKDNYYGESCNFSCSPTCKIRTTASGSVCQQTNGKCLYGCVDGFYGLQCSEKCSVYCNDTLCDRDDGQCTKGCQVKVINDPVCPLISDEPVNTAAVVFGTLFAVSVVGNIITVTVLLLLKCRKKTNVKSKSRGPSYENSEIILECGNVASIENNRITQASNSGTSTMADNYENLGSFQESEHEYGRIQPDTGLN